MCGSATQVNLNRSVSVIGRLSAARGAAIARAMAMPTRARRARTACMASSFRGRLLLVEYARARPPHCRRRAERLVRGDCGQAARSRLPDPRAGNTGQLDLSLSTADGVLHDARAARDRRPALRVA